MDMSITERRCSTSHCTRWRQAGGRITQHIGNTMETASGMVTFLDTRSRGLHFDARAVRRLPIS
jgi:hypothetical protein